jgi:hypothetical protein
MSTSEVEALARTVADLQRRLAAMERSPQLERSSVQDDAGGTYGVRAGIINGAQAASNAAAALQGLVDVQARTDGKVTVFYTQTAPTEEEHNPEYNDQWLVTGGGTNYLGTLYAEGTLLRYDGDTWLVSQDAGTAAAALAAAQNAQDTADGKIETYWAMADPAPGIPGGPRSGDLWYQVDPNPASNAVLAVWRWDLSLAGWRALPLAGAAIAVGGVSADRLSLGVTTNLVQDPAFLGPMWVPPLRTTAPLGVSDWLPPAPDEAFPDSNYLRAQNRTPGAYGSVSADSTWRLTPRIPVDAGRTVRCAVLWRCDAAAITGAILPSGTTPTLARVRVYFYRSGTADDGPALSGTDQLGQVVIGTATAGVYGTWIPLEANFTVPEGYTSVVFAVQTTYQTAGNIDFIKPEMQVLWDRMRSGDYRDGQAGWGFDSSTSQVQGMNVLETLGARLVAGEQFNVGGYDLVKDILGPLPRGIVAYDISTTGFNTGDAITVGTEYKVFEFAATNLGGGRLYRIVCMGHFESLAGDVFDLRIRHTVDGSVPTTSSTIMRNHRIRIGDTPASIAFQFEKVFSFVLQYPNVRFAICFARVGGPSPTGTGSGHIYGTGQQTTADRAFVVYVEDVGLYAGAADAGTLSQKSVQAGGTVQPDPVNTYTGEWAATWSRSYDEGLATREGVDTSDLYQGYEDTAHGHTRSLFGFNYADIQAKLAGATIKAVTLTYRVRHARLSQGAAIRLCSHNYTTKPASWAAASVIQGRMTFASQQEGVPYRQALPVAIGNELKAGTTRGLGFGPVSVDSAASANFCFLYGAGSQSAPKLIIQYTR